MAKMVPLKGAWRFIAWAPGVLFVVTAGMSRMLKLSANNWVMVVRNLSRQPHIMEKAKDRFGLMTSPVQETSQILDSVCIMAGEAMTAPTNKTLEWFVI